MKITRAFAAGLVAVSLLAAGCDSSKNQQASFNAGTYTGTGRGNNGDVNVAVTFSDSRIESVEVTSHRETPGISDPTLARIPAAIVDGQTLAVDTISGCTNTSNAILAAVEQAVVAAGGNVDALKGSTAARSTTVEEMDTDIVIAGAGASGSSAALAAVQDGAKVVLLEKAAGVSGAGTMANVMFAAHSDMQIAAGHEDLSQWLYNQYITDSSYYANARLVRNIIRESSDTVNWLVQNGMRLMLLDAGYSGQYNHVGMPATAHGYVDGGTKAVADIHERITSLGGQVLYETPATELLFDSNNKVAGVKAVRSDGTTINIHAKK